MIPSLAAGASTTVPVNLTLTGVVQSFSITESGTVTDALNNTASFSIGQSVNPAATRNKDDQPEHRTTHLAAQSLNTTSAAQSVTLSSIGTATVNLNPTAAPTGDYSISANTCGATLASGASCSVSLTFTPTATGICTRCVLDDPMTPPMEVHNLVNLTGVGQTKLLSLSTGLLDLRGQNVNTTSSAQA